MYFSSNNFYRSIHVYFLIKFKTNVIKIISYISELYNALNEIAILNVLKRRLKFVYYSIHPNLKKNILNTFELTLEWFQIIFIAV